jgi:thioredoxin 1
MLSATGRAGPRSTACARAGRIFGYASHHADPKRRVRGQARPGWPHILCIHCIQRSEVVMSSDQILHVSDASFEHDVLQSETPVLVDYWAEWCGPCKLIAPVLDDVAGQYAGRLKVAKVNIDQNSGVPTRYNVRGIPTLMLFKGGAVEATKVGAMSKSQLTAFIDSHL